MDADAIIALVVLILAGGLLVADRAKPVVVLAGAVTALLLTRVISSDTALSGLSSTAPATIAALYVVAGAATATGAFAPLIERLLGRRGADVAIVASTAGLSAFVPNTPLVAMFAPRIVRWSQRNGHSASRYLLPLSYASILGGVITLIGTSTNLVVSDLLERSGAEPLGVFEITPVGLPVAVVGLLLLVTVGRRLLPERSAAVADVGQNLREFQMAARVDPDGPLSGRSILDSGLRSLDGVFLAMVERVDVAGRVSSMQATPELVLQPGDICCFVGDVNRVIDLHDVQGLVSVERDHVLAAEGPGTRMFEAVVAPGSTLVGRSLRDADFRRRYGGAVVAIHRAATSLGGQLGRIPLRGGDVLLVLADEGFERRWRSDADFSLVAALDGPRLLRRRQAWLVTLAFVGVVVLAVSGVLPLFESAIVGAITVVLGGAISTREAWRAINLDVVLTMAAAISLGAAVAESGLAADVAQLIEWLSARSDSDRAVVAAVLIATMVLTEPLSNSAAAALMIPVALSLSADLGTDPRMLAIAVLIGASCSFLSPVGYQTNLMVFSLGGYRFADFARVGAPLNLATIVVSVLLIPVVYG